MVEISRSRKKFVAPHRLFRSRLLLSCHCRGLISRASPLALSKDTSLSAKCSNVRLCATSLRTPRVPKDDRYSSAILIASIRFSDLVLRTILFFLVLHRALPDLQRMKHKPDQALGHREVFLFLPRGNPYSHSPVGACFHFIDGESTRKNVDSSIEPIPGDFFSRLHKGRVGKNDTLIDTPSQKSKQ